MSFNVRIYGELIGGSIKGCEDADKRWLSNKMAKIHRKGWGKQSHFRLCRADGKGYSTQRYFHLQGDKPSCKFDERLTNPQTGSVFWYGFNYGN